MSDVAALAGVSVMTVSRTLRDHPTVVSETKARVLAAVEALRYQPNELARSLRDRRSRQIGVLVPYLSDPFFAQCAHEISTVAKQHSYSVVLSTSDEDVASELREANSMLRRSVDGLIVIPAHKHDEESLLNGRAFEHLPLVALDRPIEKSRFDSFLVDNEAGARLGTEHLLRLGHKRIACVGLSTKMYTIFSRQKGYSSAMRAAGLPEKSIVLSTSLEDALPALRRVLLGRNAPTALFSSNNLVTRHVLHALRLLNLSVPTQIAIVGFDDFDIADLLQPGMTVVRQPAETMARAAAECLFESLETPQATRDTRCTVFPVELVVRGSCGTPNLTATGSSEHARPRAS